VVLPPEKITKILVEKKDLPPPPRFARVLLLPEGGEVCAPFYRVVHFQFSIYRVAVPSFWKEGCPTGGVVGRFLDQVENCALAGSPPVEEWQPERLTGWFFQLKI
jgi:hypothetical protein